MTEKIITKAMADKQLVIDEIHSKLDKAQSTLLVDYIGMTVEESTDLRRQFRAAGVDFKVYKNTLINRALQEKGISGLETYLNGSTALAFSNDDPTAAARVLSKFIAKVKKTQMKAALLGTDVLDTAKAEALADIPSREVLIAMMLGVMNGPVSAFARAVDQIRQQKETAETA